MPLPLTRERTYTTATPVASADLNKIQDSIVGGKHGVKTQRIGYTRFVNPSGFTSLEYNSLGYAQNTTGALAAVAAIELPPTATIVGIRAMIDAASTNVVRVALNKFIVATATSSTASFADSTLPTAAEVVLPSVNVTMAVGEVYGIYILRNSGAAATDRIYYVDVDYYLS